MKAEQLLSILKLPLSKNKVEKLASIETEDSFSVNDLIDLSLGKNEQVGFRAAWILENIYSNHNDRFFQSTIYFLDRFSLQNNLSARRHYAKILAFLTDKKVSPQIKQLINDYDTDLIVETVFSWIIDEKVPVAVKSQCLNVLANLHQKHPWVKEELLQIMDFLIDKESIAFYAKVKQIRKRLK